MGCLDEESKVIAGAVNGASTGAGLVQLITPGAAAGTTADTTAGLDIDSNAGGSMETAAIRHAVDQPAHHSDRNLARQSIQETAPQSTQQSDVQVVCGLARVVAHCPSADVSRSSACGSVRDSCQLSQTSSWPS